MKSVSEFERTKPVKTFAAFKEVLEKYQKLSEVHPDMDEEDFGIQRTSAMVLVDIQELFKAFKKGE